MSDDVKKRLAVCKLKSCIVDSLESQSSFHPTVMYKYLECTLLDCSVELTSKVFSICGSICSARLKYLIDNHLGKLKYLGWRLQSRQSRSTIYIPLRWLVVHQRTEIRNRNTPFASGVEGFHLEHRDLLLIWCFYYWNGQLSMFLRGSPRYLWILTFRNLWSQTSANAGAVL